MTPIFFLAVYGLGVLATVFKHPIYGLFTYLFTFYMSPSHSWWATDVPRIRYLFLIGIITLLVSFKEIRSESRPAWLDFRAGKLLLGLVSWMWLQYFWAIDQETHLEGTIEYTKHVLIFYLIYKLIDTKEKIIGFLIMHVVGCFWFGYLALGASSGRLEDIGGPVGGANELGMHVSTAMITGGIMWMLLSGWRKWVVFAAIPFIANTIILTVSRGAFLGFFMGGIIGGLFMPTRYKGKYIGLAILALILISLLAHDAMIERFTATWESLTGQEEELDHSATSRLEIFRAGMEMGKDHPLGAGYRGTRILSPLYMDKSVLAKKTNTRSAHNTIAAVFAEHGYIGLVIYMSLIIWLIGTLFRVSRSSDAIIQSEDKALTVAIIAAISAMWVSGNFSNNLFTETQYWLLALLCAQLSLTLDAKETSAVDSPVRYSKNARKGPLSPTHTRSDSRRY